MPSSAESRPRSASIRLPLKIAAKVDRTDKLYFHSKIEPLLKQPGIEFTGEIDDRCKATFLGNALALLFPIDWPEPFGLVMIEAMACGTPVLAFGRAAVPEVVDEGITGHIVSTCEEAVCRIGTLLALDRARIRRRFETRFAASRMARDYVRVYHDLLTRPKIPNRMQRLAPLPSIASVGFDSSHAGTHFTSQHDEAAPNCQIGLRGLSATGKSAIDVDAHGAPSYQQQQFKARRS